MKQNLKHFLALRHGTVLFIHLLYFFLKFSEYLQFRFKSLPLEAFHTMAQFRFYLNLLGYPPNREILLGFNMGISLVSKGVMGEDFENI